MIYSVSLVVIFVWFVIITRFPDIVRKCHMKMPGYERENKDVSRCYLKA